MKNYFTNDVLDLIAFCEPLNEIAMIKKLLNQDFLEIDDPELMDNNIFVSYRRKPRINDTNGLSDIKKFEIVMEGKSGATSIAEICNRENITHDTFLRWSKAFLKLRKGTEEGRSTISNSVFFKNKQLINRHSSPEVFDYLVNYLDFSTSSTIVTLKSNSAKLDHAADITDFVNFERINDVRYINKYFEKVNSKLELGGVFAGCFETISARNDRKKIKRIPVLSNIYFAIEFLLKRVLPKVSFTKKYYFDITKGNDRLLSKAEGLGRLVSCGFKIMDFKSIDGILYFVVKKVKEPEFDLNPSYGPVYRMPRIGKNGNIIKVFKFRTMHPYSEYLQEFMVKANGYSDTGKPANDFRIPYWGKIMRKYWMDELPQLINVLKGDMKLVGIRPLSLYRFDEIPKEMQKLRLPQKPGCIPPYIAFDRDSDVMSLLQAEKDYIEEKVKNPYTTDLKCFFKAVYNIVFKNKRSA